MPGGGFIGNGSVKWYVESSDAETGQTRIKSSGAYGLHHEGIENTNGGGYRFVITIRHPKNAKQRNAFLERLAKAAANTKARRTVLTIPVEDRDSGYSVRANPKKSEYQITVAWQPPKGTKKPKASKYKSEPVDITL